MSILENGSVYAYLFPKKKSSEEGDFADSDDLILVFTGSGTSVNTYDYAFDSVDSSSDF